MITREERLAHLKSMEKDFNSKIPVVFLITFLIGIGTAIWIYISSSFTDAHVAVLFLTLALPFIYIGWKKTRVWLTFNEYKPYQRLIYVKGIVDVLMLLVTLFLLIAFPLDIVSSKDFSTIIIATLSSYFLIDTWLDYKLLQVDSEHLTSSLFSLTKRERMKRKWD